MGIVHRLALFGGAQNPPPSAKSYVQNGLVAQWDGIENAAYGVHDSSSGRVVELVQGGWDFTGKIVLDDCMKFTGNCPQTTLTDTISGRLGGTIVGSNYFSTFEVVGYRDSVSDSSSLVRLSVILNNTNGTMSIQVGAWYYKDGTLTGINNLGRRVVADEYLSPHIVSCVSYTTRGTQNNSTRLYYGDGEYKDIATGSLGYDITGISRNPSINITNASEGNLFINSIRLYNRALTADEIAANYAVDRVRFNLA